MKPEELSVIKSFEKRRQNAFNRYQKELSDIFREEAKWLKAIKEYLQ